MRIRPFFANENKNEYPWMVVDRIQNNKGGKAASARAHPGMRTAGVEHAYPVEHGRAWVERV